MNVRKTPEPAGWSALRSEQNWAVLCCAGLVLLLFADFSASFELRFTPFYIFAIALAAWTAPARVGMGVTAVASVTSVVREFRTAGESASGWEITFNALLQVLLCVFVVLLVSSFRNLKRHLQQQVREQTHTLQSEVTERRTTQEQLHKSLQQLRQLADNISDVFWMRNAGELRLGYVSPAYEKIWGRPCRELYQSPQLWTEAIHDEDRERVMNAMRTQQTTGDYKEEYRVVRPDGSLRWIRDRSFPIRTSSGEVVRVVGIAEDVTDRRRLEREILEISDREQARIGQDLHDSLCQKLVTLAFDHGQLENDLAAKAIPEAKTVGRMAQLLDDLISQARSIAHGLFPVHLDADGLHHGLEELAASVRSDSGMHCRVERGPPVPVHNGVVAMQLYRIAQEAVTNALKHSHASEIRMMLTTTDQRIELEIRDNGIGLPPETTSKSGMGLHIMEYRARTIGATLSLSQNAAAGTAVKCIAPQTLG